MIISCAQNKTYQGPTWRSKTFIYMSPYVYHACKKLGPLDIGKGWSSGIGYKKNRRSLSTFRLCSGGYWYPINMSFCMADEQTEAGIPVKWTVQVNCGEFHFASHEDHMKGYHMIGSCQNFEVASSRKFFSSKIWKTISMFLFNEYSNNRNDIAQKTTDALLVTVDNPW